MDLALGEKVFVLTGGSRGLGLELAERLLQEGAKVALMARDEAQLLQVGQRLEEIGEVQVVSGDVTRLGNLEMLIGTAMERWGQIDGVINNAGALAAGPFEGHADDTWRNDLELKLLAAVRLIRLALPALRDSRGVVLNTLSTTAKAPEAQSTPTCVSRAAGLAMTKALSRELGPSGIRVNAVLVGVVESDQLERLATAAGVTPEVYYTRMTQDCEIPLGRVGRRSEYADLCAFLLSARASYVTGAAVNLDGGLCPVP
jgi:NAD(P)-dependent dehydrogenase (short-subunit alcohol dehydrogenase family)